MDLRFYALSELGEECEWCRFIEACWFSKNSNLNIQTLQFNRTSLCDGFMMTPLCDQLISEFAVACREVLIWIFFQHFHYEIKVEKESKIGAQSEFFYIHITC